MRNLQEGIARWQQDRGRFASLGVSFADGFAPSSYIPEPFLRDFRMAMDAQPALTTDPNSSVPWFLTAMVDPKVFKILFAPNKAALLRQPSTCAKKSLHTGISQGLPSVIPRHASTHSKVNSLVNSYVDERSGHSERPAIRR